MSASSAFAAEVAAAILDHLTNDAASARRLRAVLTLAPQIASAVCTRRELAAALRVSVATIDRAVRGGCPVERVGAKRRFDVEKVRAWFDARGRRSTLPDDEDPVNISRALERRHTRGRRKVA